jgi:uncharacterized oligopeptide transporter (OPT) family protein
MMSSTLTTFAFDIAAALRMRSERAATRVERAPWLALAAFGGVVVIVTGRVVFGLPIIPSLLVLLLSVPIAEATMRALGETDLAPVGTGGQLVQIGASSTVAHAAMQNLPLGNITVGVSSHAVASILALRIGERLGAKIRPQLIAQLVGTAVGIASAIPAYVVISKAYRIGGTAIPAPGVMPWKAVAEAAQHGAAAIPPYATTAACVAFAAGTLFSLLGRVERLRALVPSPTAMGLGMLVPQFYASTICLGAIAGAAVRRRAQSWLARELEATASGLIVGESIVGVIVAALIVAGVL